MGDKLVSLSRKKVEISVVKAELLPSGTCSGEQAGCSLDAEQGRAEPGPVELAGALRW